MKQLLSRESFELWLAGDPDVRIILEHLQFLDFWIEKLRNGGGQYVQELKDMAYEHIKLKAEPRQE